MKTLECLTRRFLEVIFSVLALVPLPPISQLGWLFLSLAIRCCWIVYFIYLLDVAISFSWVAIENVGNAVGTMLFVGNSVLGFALLLESVLKQKTHSQLEDLRVQTELQLQRLGMFGRSRHAAYLLPLIGVQFTCDLVRLATNFGETVSPVFCISLPLMWLLRYRYVQLVQHVMDLNQRSIHLRRSLLSMASGNDLWQPYGVQECLQLQTLRTTYERIFECYETFSDCYGWGMLGLHLLTSFQFVTNAYWMIMGIYDGGNVRSLIFNGATGIDFGTPIATLFWHGDSGAENGRQIGCLISKLVKPQGSKLYNDLVSEFSLQTLHQRFVVTAKDFFSLNLHLLSSMFAAVVTYLVILIQFMFAERSSTRGSG
uniref:Isoform C of Gustatory receptor 23a n=1 Tax=Drosophila melanogaster TaxID=7227 RepID=P83292-2|nr:gustatory receptor 23a, isoform C [Drosophila melanogaster]AAF51227.3 gustatory receptor 23a, isoform C [Drosophila melanogaster]|eukprot:NP_523459.3 gustatory receptor 23a, isoform C [Drosophila melanogaster]